MIINSVGNTKITIGNTQEYKTTIDVENLDFIATLLSSNLYSKPVESFIREIVSNGWDSHVAANNTKTPIIIKIDRLNYGNYNVVIRDYGTGLSKEEFENLYCKIGSSTKRSSNDYLGCFGIGKFATMAVSKVSYITSYYNGVARHYIMTKDGNSITTNLVSETPTQEKNGLEVTIKSISDIYEYRKAIDEIIFFPNVYVDGYSEFNNIKTKRYTKFSVANVTCNNKLLLGNVLYPLKTDFLDKKVQDQLRLLDHSGFVFNFNIGELAVTPNREAVIYNNKTEELIKRRIEEAFEEVGQIISKNVNLDFENPYEYYRFNFRDIEYDFFSDTVNYYRSYKHPGFNNNYLNLNLSLLGKTFSDDCLNVIPYCEKIIPNVKAVVTYDKVYKERFPWSVLRIRENTQTPILMMKADQRFVNHLNAYLTENYKNTIVCNNFDFSDYANIFFKASAIDCTNTPTKFLVQTCYNWLLKRCTVFDVDNDADFISYKEEKKKEAKGNKVKVNNVILHVQHSKFYTGKHHFDTLDKAISYIKGLNKGIIFKPLNSTSRSTLLHPLGYISIGANKAVLEHLKKANLRCEVKEEDILHNKKLIMLNSLFKSELSVGRFTSSFLHTLPKDLRSFAINLSNLYESFDTYSLEKYLEITNVPIDEDIVNKCNLIHKYNTLYTELVNSIKADNYVSVFQDIINYIIVKQKLYRISFDCYKKVKNNLILKKLCQK